MSGYFLSFSQAVSRFRNTVPIANIMRSPPWLKVPMLKLYRDGQRFPSRPQIDPLAHLDERLRILVIECVRQTRCNSTGKKWMQIEEIPYNTSRKFPYKIPYNSGNTYSPYLSG